MISKTEISPEMESILEFSISLYKTHCGNFDKYKLLSFQKHEFSHLESYCEIEIEFITVLFFGIHGKKIMNSKISFKKEVLKVKIE